MARSRPDPAAFAFRAEMVRDPAPELDDAAHTCLGNVLAQRQEVTGAWLVRERRTRVVHGSDDEGTTTHLVLHLATASASGNGAGMTCDDAVALAPGLPEASVGTACGTPALRVRKAFSGRVREDGEALALRCGAGKRPLPIEASPSALRVAPHPRQRPMVLVALPHAGEGLVRELVEDAWSERAPKQVVRAWRAEH